MCVRGAGGAGAGGHGDGEAGRVPHLCGLLSPPPPRPAPPQLNIAKVLPSSTHCPLQPAGDISQSFFMFFNYLNIINHRNASYLINVIQLQ